MSKPEQSQPPRVVIGERLREIRGENPDLARQDDVAARMRLLHGFEWTRATVAAIETGRREVSIEELIGLSIVCEVEVASWFEGEGRVSIGQSWATRRMWAAFLGSDERISPRQQQQELFIFGREAMRQHPDVAMGAVMIGHLAFIWPGGRQLEGADEALTAMREADSEAVKRAAERLDVLPVTTALLSHGLWGRGLVEERDARVAERADADADERSLRTLRGHVTRDLTDELEAVIRDNDVRLREKRLQHELMGGNR